MVEPKKLATKKEWIGLAIIALPCLLYAMDLTVLYLAVPHLTKDLKPSSSELLWIVDIYGFLVAGFLVTMGTLGDRIGRRKLLLIGCTAFGIASALAAYSNSAKMLILTRAILGVTAATIAPSTLSLIRNMFQDDNERTFAIGIWGSSFSLGGAIGPLVGGLLLEYFSWGSVFLISIPVMILLLLTAPKLLPEYKDPNAGKMDILSAILSLASVLTIIFGIKQIAELGFQINFFVFIILGIVIGYLFFKRQTKLKDPLIDLNLFKFKKFNISLAGNSFTIFIALGSFLFISQYLQLVLGLSPLEAGLWTLPSALGNIIGSMLIPTLAKRYKQIYIVTSGLILNSIGLILYAFIGTQYSLFLLVSGSLIFSLGICCVVILGTDIIVSSAPVEKAGAAASISETGVEFGGVLGIAILGSLGTAIFRNKLSSFQIQNTDMNELSKNTLGAILSYAKEINTNESTLLIEFAKKSFTESLQIVCFICAFISICLAIFVYKQLSKN